MTTKYTVSNSNLAYINAILPFAKPYHKSHGDEIPFAELVKWSKSAGYSAVPIWVTTPERKVRRAVYSFPELFADQSQFIVTTSKRGRPAGAKAKATVVKVKGSTRCVVAPQSAQVSTSSTVPVSMSSDTVSMITQLTGNDYAQSFVPDVDPNYIAWGYYREITQLLKSKAFCPLFITGMSGNGKTTMIEQICAKLGRECIRVNFTAATDEDELLGGFRLLGGETRFVPGPVLVAMQRGAVLLLDEVDLGSHLTLCLQSVLEGKGKFIPKIGSIVRPAPGFTIVATANTKGKGSTDGRFAGTNIMNEAFLDRYRFTYEQDYAPPATEKKILDAYASSLGVDDPAFTAALVGWADIIRKSFKQEIVSEIITTRRLRDIVFAFSVFGDKMQSIERCVSRFDDETKTAFMEFYTKIDASANPEATPAPVETNTTATAGSPPF